jgi:NADPH:quinone reductase-like Zn-dependent oxidoreductase
MFCCLPICLSAGYKPITVCSPRNFDFVKGLGAIEAFDYMDPNIVGSIKKFTDNQLKYVWDTISLPESVKICAEVISDGGVYGNLLDVDFPRDGVKVTFSLGYTATGERLVKDPYNIEDTTEDFKFVKAWITLVEPLLAAGTVRSHPTTIDHGFEHILHGLDLLRKDKVSGKKLVYTV